MGKLIGLKLLTIYSAVQFHLSWKAFVKNPHFFTVVVLHEKTKIKITRTEFCLDKDTQNNTAL